MCSLRPAAVFVCVLAVVSGSPAMAGRLGSILQSGPFPHLQGEVLRQQIGPATAGAWSEPTSGDWDGDGDEDLIVGSGYGDLMLFTRRADGYVSEGLEMLPEEVALMPSALEKRPVSPAMVDWDEDGQEDLLLGLDGRVYFCRRNGDGLEAARELVCGTESLTARLTAMAPGAGHLAPCPADLDLDGDLDLLLGDDEGHVWWVCNDGSPGKPRLQDPRRLAAGGRALSVNGRARVAVGDMNNDRYPDVFVAGADGTVYVSLGSPQGPGTPAALYGRECPGAGPDALATTDTSPSFCRWDGAPSLLLGQRGGHIGLLALSATGAEYRGEVQGLRQPIDVGRCAVPCPVDWDGDGDVDLVVGGEDGYIRYFERIAEQPPLFSAGKQLVAGDEPIRAQGRAGVPDHLRYAWPALADADSDGDLDMLLGQASGNTQLWVNSGGFRKPEDLAVAGSVFSLSGAGTVSALDYDQDGDVDVFVGNRLIPGYLVGSHLAPETVIYLENSASRKPQSPVFVKAVRIDAFIRNRDTANGVRDADLLRISFLQPVHWNRDAKLDFMLTTALGAYLFHTDLSRAAYPRLELRTTVTGTPLPLVPPSWCAYAVRLCGGLPGLVCGMEETGWLVWYARENLLGPQGNDAPLP